jgi:ADP-ribosyl-[dinitrogen reductase] hydrolase
MLLELAVGDAYGAGFEYANRQVIRQFNDLKHYHKHPRHSIRPGQYTDDTQMTLAITESILSGEDWTAQNLAERFVNVFKRDPREGYATSFFSFLKRMETGTQFLAEIIPTSDKSGAAMRSIPIGIFPNLQDVIDRTTLQAAITHNTSEGIDAAVATALMSHYFLYNLGPKNDVGLFIESHVEGDWADPWRGQVGPKGWMSVKAAITAVRGTNRLSDLLRACIDYSGDVDTVATIALGAASCSTEFEQDLPQVLIDGFENTPYGRDYLVNHDRALSDYRQSLFQPGL